MNSRDILYCLLSRDGIGLDAFNHKAVITELETKVCSVIDYVCYVRIL